MRSKDILGELVMSKNVLSVFKVNNHGTLAVVIPAREAKELEINENSTLAFSRVGNSLHYNKVVIL